MQTAVKLITIVEMERESGLTRRTIRIYENAGLIEPAVIDAGKPSYPETTLERLKRIRRLKEELGVNLAGVQVILEMREKIEHLQATLDEVVRFVNVELKEELAHYCRREEKAVVPHPLAKPPGKI